MKALKKNFLIRNKQLKNAITEASILKTIKHPFILRLHYSFQVIYLFISTKIINKLM